MHSDEKELTTDSSERENETADLFSKVGFYLRLHRYDAAEKLLKSEIAAKDNNPELYNWLGVTYHKQSRFPEAVAQFQNALKVAPNFLEASINLSATLSDLGQYEKAQEIFATNKTNVWAKTGFPKLFKKKLAWQHLKTGQLYQKVFLVKEAMEEYHKALSLDERTITVRLLLANLYLKQKQFEKAKQTLEEILTFSPYLNEARNILGFIHYELGQTTFAKEHWEKSLEYDPEDKTAQIYLEIITNFANDQ